MGSEAADGSAACAFYGLQPSTGQDVLKAAGWQCTQNPSTLAWTGTDPCSWGKASGIVCNGGHTVSAINLDCTKLTGTLGGKLGDSLPLYTCLSSLAIKNCGLTGPLPAVFSRKNTLMSLSSLVLSNNTLSGSLPQYMGQGGSMDSLNNLDLSYNKFVGGLPARWASKGFFVNLFTLNLRNNNGLYGSVPPSWGQTSASWPATCAINIGSTGIKGPLSPLMNSGNFRIFANVGPGFICGKLPKAMADPGTDGGVYPSWRFPNASRATKYTTLPAC
ncbi:hypothetical protein ABPG77_000725 [Micractinium sp. CCAP 211/92]